MCGLMLPGEPVEEKVTGEEREDLLPQQLSEEEEG